MIKSLHFIGSIVLIGLWLTSTATARTSLPPATYEIVSAYLLIKAPFISDFECLVEGENLASLPACNYYKAVISGPQTADPISEVCFKEIAVVSVPREYKADQNYRIIIETETRPNAGDFEGVTLARIVSGIRENDETFHPEAPNWHETTTVGFYACDQPYDGKSYN